MNEALTIAGAIFAVLTALIFNRKDVNDLKADMKESNAALRAEMKESNAALRADVKESILNLRAEMRDGFAQMNARMDKMQGDINTFAIVNALHDQRITTLEASAKN